MAARKTITVEALKNRANDMLIESRADMQREREGIAALLESVLMESGNYHGYRYRDGNNGDTDPTRRTYY